MCGCELYVYVYGCVDVYVHVYVYVDVYGCACGWGMCMYNISRITLIRMCHRVYDIVCFACVMSRHVIHHV